jgi:opacity protein-like surface antigen
MRKTFGIALLSVFVTMALQGAGPEAAAGNKRAPFLTALLRAGYFMPAQAEFRDIYGGGPAYGVELRLGRGRLNAWLEGGYFAHSGKLSQTAEATDVRITALEAGAMWKFKPGKMTPYVGAGAGYYQYKETNVIGEAKQAKAGFCGLAGAIWDLGKRLVLDGRLKYNTCSMQPADFKINIGGLTAAIGLGLYL